MGEESGAKISRRGFLKLGALGGLAAQAITIPGMAYKHGKSYRTYTGWESFEGSTQYINRKPYELKSVDELYTKYFPIEGEIKRPNNQVDQASTRAMQIMMKARMSPGFKVEDGPEALGLPQAFLDFYKEKNEMDVPQDRFPTDYDLGTVTIPDRLMGMGTGFHQKYSAHFALSTAVFEAGWGENCEIPEEITDPPDPGDFQVSGGMMGMGGQKLDIRDINAEREKRGELLKFRSPDLASELIKKITHMYGATIVGIAKFNPNYTYTTIRGLSAPRGSMMMGAGAKPSGPMPYDALDPVPKHWKYIIVFGIPHEWDQLVSNPQYGDSTDAYTRLRMTGIRLTACLKSLGYAARWHVPPGSYDIVVPPYAVEAGLGQFGRMGTVICPETGGDIRLGAVTTNLEMTPDKPVDFGVTEFCKKCKICAELCPSNSITYADEPENVIRGIRHWDINTSTCAKYWMETLGPIGCRLCIACCPYSRKNNWVHGIARAFDPIDPTGLMADSLIWMQKTFFKAPKKEDYLPPPDGTWAAYRPRPDWLNTEKYFDISPPNPKDLGK